MKSKLTKVVSLAMAVAIIISMAMPFASAAKKQTNYGTYGFPVTCNASVEKLPSRFLFLDVDRQIYFNFQVDSSQYVKWVEAYVVYERDWRPELVAKRDTAQNYMRYTSFKYDKAKAKAHVGETMYYYFKVKYTDGTTKTWPEGKGNYLSAYLYRG